MKKLSVLIVIILALLISGCSAPGNSQADPPQNDPPQTEPGMRGYVMSIDNNGRILVIDPVPQNFSSTGGVSEFYNAIWFADAPTEITVGQKVEVWYDMVADSYPGQSVAEHVEVIPAPQPEGANLNEAEALQQALTQIEPGDKVVKSIKYNEEESMWFIELKQIWEDEIHIIEVND